MKDDVLWVMVCDVCVGFEYDFECMVRFFVVGVVLYGLFFYVVFCVFERVMGASTNAATVARKVVVGYMVLFLMYMVGFFFFMSVLEGEMMMVVYDRFRDKVVEMFISGTCYWSFANAFNFAYVSRVGRILFFNVVGVVWNVYMSYVVSVSDDGKS